MYFIIFVFKSSYRSLALNNFIKTKKLENFFIINLSGPFMHLFGRLIYKYLKFNNVIFVSCDGHPFLYDENNAVNLWVGGTNFKISKKYLEFKNNKVLASTIFTDRKLLLQLFPVNINYLKLYKDFKFIFISRLRDEEIDYDVKKIWEKNKLEILKNLSLVDNLNFWISNLNNFHSINNLEKQKKYIQLKCLVRIEIVTQFKNFFSDNLLVIGSDWKKYIPEALKDTYSLNEIKKYYKGNICIDLGAKDGDEIFYPRSIQIIENGGFLFQSVQKIYNNNIAELYKKISFNSKDEMFEKAQSFLKNPENFEEMTYLFYKFIENNYNNYSNLINNLKKI
jgi:hypothetical protein